MKYLFLSTATTDLVVAIAIDGRIVFESQKSCMNDMSGSIMPVIDEAFKKAQITPKELNKIFVVNGPGSFTGIRIGLTLAKTMAWALNIPVVPISTLEMLVSGSSDSAVALIDARRGYVYAGGYDEKLVPFMDDKYMEISNLDNTKHFISNDEFDFTVEKPNLDLLKVMNKHEKDEGINPHSLKPKYLKNTEAEEKLNK